MGSRRLLLALPVVGGCALVAGCGSSQPSQVGLSLVAPSPGASVSVSSIEVAGDVTPSDARVLVQNVPVTVHGGTFSSPLELAHGTTHITVTAQRPGLAPATVQTSVSYGGTSASATLAAAVSHPLATAPQWAAHIVSSARPRTRPARTTRTSTHTTTTASVTGTAHTGTTSASTPAPTTTTSSSTAAAPTVTTVSTTTTITTTTTTARPAHPTMLSAAIRDQALASCVTIDGDRAYCGCVIRTVVRRGALRRFQSEFAFLQSFDWSVAYYGTRPTPVWYRSAVALCTRVGGAPDTSLMWTGPVSPNARPR